MNWFDFIVHRSSFIVSCGLIQKNKGPPAAFVPVMYWGAIQDAV